jgi:hypothetical protein
MTKAEVTNIVKRSLVKIVVIDIKTGRIISQGSGVVVNRLGFILTAFHVVSSMQGNNSQVAIAIPYGGGGTMFYSLIFGGISFEVREQNYIKPALIDLAVLAPNQPVSIPPIAMMQVVPTEGTEVIMAGFPEDLKPPLNFSEHLNKDAFSNKNDIERIKEFSRYIIPWIMVKHGIIGGVFHIVTPNMSAELLGSSVTFPLQAAEYWIDNTYARGASGGPVVDMDGNLLGIITERGETMESDFMETFSFPVPSGTVRVLSHKLLTWSLQELENKWKAPF